MSEINQCHGLLVLLLSWHTIGVTFQLKLKLLMKTSKQTDDHMVARLNSYNIVVFDKNQTYIFVVLLDCII